MTPDALTRRTMLRGAGAAMALPWLEAMATPITGLSSALASTPTGQPKRLAFLFVPNGVHAPHWTPDGVGADWTPFTTAGAAGPGPAARQRAQRTVASQCQGAGRRTG